MKSMSTIVVSVLVAVLLTGCATKKFVRQSVGDVNAKVVSQGATLEKTQERVTKIENRVAEVDTTATAAQKSASAAQQSADGAQKSANAAADIGQQATVRVGKVEADVRKLIFEVTINAESGDFKRNQSALPESVSAALDALVAQVKQSNAAVWFEVEGHTDTTGDSVYNKRLGLSRAEAVKEYLHEKHQVPLHKINIVSYGETRPVAPNTTKAGRAKNRRIVVRVVA